MSLAGLVAVTNFYQHVEEAYEEVMGRRLKLSENLEAITEVIIAHIDLCDLCKHRISEAPGSYQKIREAVDHTFNGVPVTIPATKESYCACIIA